MMKGNRAGLSTRDNGRIRPPKSFSLSPLSKIQTLCDTIEVGRLFVQEQIKNVFDNVLTLRGRVN